MAMQLLSVLYMLAVADTVTVRSTGPGKWGNELRLVEELRIGSEAPGDSMFGEIGEIVQAPDGTIYVYDDKLRVLRAFDARGRFLHRIGRNGRGPGEFQSVLGMVPQPGGNLLVYDPFNARIISYSAEGKTLG